MDVRKIAWQVVFGLVLIFLGGWICGGILNMVSFVSPQIVTLVDCPTGSTAKEEWIQQSWDHPGEKTLTITCVNSSGTKVTPLTDEQSRALEYKIFYPAGVAVMAVLVVAWFIRSARKNAAQAKTSSSSS